MMNTQLAHPARSRSVLTGLVFVLAAATSTAIAGSAARKTPYEQINAQAALAQITVQPLRGNLTVLMGSGGNITVLTSPDAKLMVDAGITLSRRGLEPALAHISANPIKYLINTHWHWDHTDGNEWIHALAGATIIGHENTLKHLSGTVQIAEWNHTFEPIPPAARPTSIVTTEKTLNFGGESILIKDYALAHTDGDLYVYFPKADVLATGDTLEPGRRRLDTRSSCRDASCPAHGPPGGSSHVSGAS